MTPRKRLDETLTAWAATDPLKDAVAATILCLADAAAKISRLLAAGPLGRRSRRGAVQRRSRRGAKSPRRSGRRDFCRLPARCPGRRHRLRRGPARHPPQPCRAAAGRARPAGRLLQYRHRAVGRLDFLDPAARLRNTRPCTRGDTRTRIFAPRHSATGRGLRALRSAHGPGAERRRRARTSTFWTGKRHFSPRPGRAANPRGQSRIRHQHVELPALGRGHPPLYRRLPERPGRSSQNRFQHALARLHGRRGAPHFQPRRHLSLPRRRAKRLRQRPAAADLRGQPHRHAGADMPAASPPTAIAPILEKIPAKLHQRTPLVFGAREKVERLASYLHGPGGTGERAPLFRRRTLFCA